MLWFRRARTPEEECDDVTHLDQASPTSPRRREQTRKAAALVGLDIVTVIQ